MSNDIDQINASPDVCWVDLVVWDMDRIGDAMRLVDEQTSFSCKQDAARCGTCYCGKFATQAAADTCRAEFNSEYQPFIVEQSS